MQDTHTQVWLLYIYWIYIYICMNQKIYMIFNQNKIPLPTQYTRIIIILVFHSQQKLHLRLYQRKKRVSKRIERKELYNKDKVNKLPLAFTDFVNME